MSAAELRHAAETLRERADHANAEDVPWTAQLGAVGTAWINTPAEHHAISAHGWPAAATYIATVHPGVGLALADLLDARAGWFESGYTEAHSDTQTSALAIARLINGGAS